jgi:hypothetical protein
MDPQTEAFWWLLIGVGFTLLLVLPAAIYEFGFRDRDWIRRLRNIEAGRRAQRGAP